MAAAGGQGLAEMPGGKGWTWIVNLRSMAQLNSLCSCKQMAELKSSVSLIYSSISTNMSGFAAVCVTWPQNMVFSSLSHLTASALHVLDLCVLANKLQHPCLNLIGRCGTSRHSTVAATPTAAAFQVACQACSSPQTAVLAGCVVQVDRGSCFYGFSNSR